jgi:MFS family permease
MPSYIETFGHLTPTMRGFTVSLIMLCGAIPAIVAGHLADRFGRLRIMIVGAILCTIGCVLEVYICEIAPSRSRGKFVSLPQFGAAMGVCIGYFACYGSAHIAGGMSWRLPYILQAALATIWAVGSFFLPESPRWLILHGKREKALKELERLNFEAAEAEKDVLRPIETAAPEAEVGVLEGLKVIFTKQYRVQTFLAVFILSFIQLSGIDGVLYVGSANREIQARSHLLTLHYSTLQLSSPKQEYRLRQLRSSHLASPLS